MLTTPYSPVISYRIMNETELQILIDHLQNEVDYLKSEMDACISDWDFQGAEAFKNPLIYTQRKLEVLKCVKDPKYKKTSQLLRMISQLEKGLNKRRFDHNLFTEETRKRMEKQLIKSILERIEKSKLEVEKLEAIPLHSSIDDDTILNLLDELNNDKLKRIEIELKQDKIYLDIIHKNNSVILRIFTKNDKVIDHYLTSPSKSILYKLGFNNLTYKKEIKDFKNENKFDILEVIAIITFEIFGLTGDQKLNVKIDE